MKAIRKKRLMISRFLFLILVLFLMVFPLISSSNLEIKTLGDVPVYISELRNPILFDLEITNLGSPDYFEFYNLLGFLMYPTEKIYMDRNETKEINLELISLENISQSGFYTITYYIAGSDKSYLEKKLTFKIVNLKDVFLIGSGEIDPESNFVEVYIRNNENVDIGEIKTTFTSPFFKTQKDFYLGPKETKTFKISLDKKDFKDLTAGFYTFKAQIETLGEEAVVEGVIKFVEKNIFTTSRTKFGVLVTTQVIENNNEGNIIETAEITVKKNIISRLFTTFNPEPDIVQREGSYIYYTWISEIRPGETQVISVRTNWMVPFLIIFSIGIILFLASRYTKTTIMLKKKVTFVKSKGGEFAIKVSILVNARKSAERVNVIDKLPPLVEIYNRFGGEQPSKIDKKNRRLEWNFEKLEEGERRVLSYIVYSKVGVLGKFAFPSATAIYEKNNKVHESESNRAFFVVEQGGKEIEED